MDKLIEYIPEKTNILIEMILELPFTFGLMYMFLIYIFFKLMCISGFDLFYEIKKKTKNKKYILKLGFLSVFCTIILITLICSIPFLDEKYNNYRKQYEPKQISIIDIKDNITIDNNKVIIKPLEQNYKYKDDKFDKTKEQTFKIEYDEFYNKYFLTDQYFTRHEISKEEYDMLKNK
jgi:hypothetical protein